MRQAYDYWQNQPGNYPLYPTSDRDGAPSPLPRLSEGRMGNDRRVAPHGRVSPRPESTGSPRSFLSSRHHPRAGGRRGGRRASPEARGASAFRVESERAPRRPPFGLCRASLGTGPPQEPRRLPSNREAKTQAADGMRALGRGVPARRITRFAREPG